MSEPIDDIVLEAIRQQCISYPDRSMDAKGILKLADEILRLKAEEIRLRAVIERAGIAP